jgi:iron complex outermembrane receptor protein
MAHYSSHALTVLLLISVLASAVSGQVVTPPPDLSRATLEELMTIKITSVSRKEQRADDAAAAVFVLTKDDIRRSGVRTLPELFRLVPGVQVAQINSRNWAVGIRGFNDQFSNKLLVLIDGRSIYKRNFSGIFWDAEDVMIEDIERIEVVRGPGGAVWGANAVNGVINIVTRTAASTAGAYVAVTGGTVDRLQATARYGGTIGNAAYRVYTQWSDRGETGLADDTPAGDPWRTLTSGIRADWARGANEWTVDGSFRSGDGQALWRFLDSTAVGLRPTTDRPASFHTGNVLGRWTHRGGGGSALQVQSVVALSRRSDNVTERENTFDTQVQYHVRAGTRHDLVTGGGYRLVDNTTGQSLSFSLTPPASRTTVSSFFAQDEIAIGSRLHLTLGAKLERDTFAGWGVQPTARVMWRPASRQRVWLSASRALRTPSNTDLGVRLNVAVVPGAALPVMIAVLGNPDYQVEEFQDAEAGYRFELGSMFSLDATVFRGRYNGLPTHEPLPPVFEAAPGPPHLLVATRYENRLDADTAGLEIAARFAPTRAWRLDGSYSGFHVTAHPSAATRDPAAAAFDGGAPAHQWQLHSTAWLGPRTEVNAALFYTGPLRAFGVPAYTRADARVAVTLNRHMSLAAVGRNLFDPSHDEFLAAAVVSTQVRRSADIQLVWRY